MPPRAVWKIRPSRVVPYRLMWARSSPTRTGGIGMVRVSLSARPVRPPPRPDLRGTGDPQRRRQAHHPRPPVPPHPRHPACREGRPHPDHHEDPRPQSAGMSMTYANISDPVVLADYQSVVQPGAVIAGPAGRHPARRAARPGRPGLAQDQLLQNRAGARPLPAPAPGRPVRVRPLSDLRQVRHHSAVRAAAPRTPLPRGAARRRRPRARLGA
jgi:hypothetical protein